MHQSSMLRQEEPQVLIDRFTAACEADARVVAAFLGGSHALGTADAYSDLDFCLITSDASHEEFVADRELFIRRLGEPVFLESFGEAFLTFFILADGTECELAIGREGEFQHIHGGPFRVLLDRKGVLDGADFPWDVVDADEQRETLRRQIYWFWHDLSHFTAAIGRGQLWWAYGQLDTLRRICVMLARLRWDFSGPPDGYDKLEKAVPSEHLSPLSATCCPLEPDAMLQAALVIVQFYRDNARFLAEAHGVAYPDRLDRVKYARLQELVGTRSA